MIFSCFVTFKDEDICPELHKDWYEEKAKTEGDYQYIPMSNEEYRRQSPFYTGNSVNEIIALCFVKATGKYNFTDDKCPANNLTFIRDDNDSRMKGLLFERRVQLCDAITKVYKIKIHYAFHFDNVVALYIS